MKTIILNDAAHLEGYEGAFYRFTTDDGEPSVMGIWDERYEATATDSDGNEYLVVWEISDREAFDSGDEDCCDWDDPAEIIDLETGLPISAKIEW